MHCLVCRSSDSAKCTVQRQKWEIVCCEYAGEEVDYVVSVFRVNVDITFGRTVLRRIVLDNSATYAFRYNFKKDLGETDY